MTEQHHADKDQEIILHASWFKRAAKSFFFESMRKGYVTDTEKGTLLELPGTKTIENIDGKWRLLDAYIVTPVGDRSGGITTMWYGDVPIWMMQYVGWYTDDAIDCLRAALSVCYGKDVFNGGRGPDSFDGEGYRYQNFVAQNDFFGHSNGLERIFVPGGIECGMHRYQSQWLITGGTW